MNECRIREMLQLLIKSSLFSVFVLYFSVGTQCPEPEIARSKKVVISYQQ